MKKIKQRTNKKGGFTLFELLVSISIIGILTALASVAFSGAQKKARDARRMEDIKAIQTAAEQYYSQNNYVYPTSDVAPWTGGGQNILNVFPVDPKNDVANGYVYVYDDIPIATTTYCVCAKVENTNNGNSAEDDCTADFSTTGSYFCAKNQQ